MVFSSSAYMKKNKNPMIETAEDEAFRAEKPHTPFCREESEGLISIREL